MFALFAVFALLALLSATRCHRGAIDGRAA